MWKISSSWVCAREFITRKITTCKCEQSTYRITFPAIIRRDNLSTNSQLCSFSICLSSIPLLSIIISWKHNRTDICFLSLELSLVIWSVSPLLVHKISRVWMELGFLFWIWILHADIFTQLQYCHGTYLLKSNQLSNRPQEVSILNYEKMDVISNISNE